jgi:hypothetical protein
MRPATNAVDNRIPVMALNSLGHGGLAAFDIRHYTFKRGMKGEERCIIIR